MFCLPICVAGKGWGGAAAAPATVSSEKTCKWPLVLTGKGQVFD